MDKKATLLPEETLKVIIAAICIVALIFLLVSLYFAATGGQNKKLAEASLRKLSNETTRVNDGGAFDSQGILIPNPTGWYVFSFVGSDLKPNLCIEENCVCICEDTKWYNFDWQKKLAKNCDDKGSCTVVSNLKKFDKIKIEGGGTVIYIKKVNGEIEITRK